MKNNFLEAQASINTLPQMDTEKTQKDSVKFCEILWLRSFLGVQASINTLPQMDTEKTQKDSVKFCEILWLRSFLDEVMLSPAKSGTSFYIFNCCNRG